MPKTLRIGDVVILSEDESNRVNWWMGMTVFNARDGVVRTVKPRAGKSFFEKPVHFLYQ